MKRSLLFILAGFSALALSACGVTSDWGMAGPNYRPLSSEVAAMAAPQSGPPVYCVAGKGSARYAKGWFDFKPVDFVLFQSNYTHVPLPRLSGNENAVMQGFFDRDGQKLIFCPSVKGPPDKRISCASLYALDDDLQMGIKRTFDVPDVVMGGQIACGYDKSHLPNL